MSSEDDRIPVPTNGRRPKPVTAAPALGQAAVLPAAQAAEPSPAAPAAAVAPAATVAPAAPAAPPTVVFTPTQLAVGFGILASLVVLVAGRIRRRGRSGRGRFGGR